MSENDDDLEEYIFQGKEGELVPFSVEKLVISQSVRVLPRMLCYEYDTRLRQVTLSFGLIRIETDAFSWCENLLEINKIPSTMQHIGEDAFYGCKRLTKVGFEISTASAHHHQLQTIEKGAFGECISLQRIKLPSSVTSVGKGAFATCNALKEANLLTAHITNISDCAFCFCSALQTVSLPNTLERIDNYAFSRCTELVTVVVPLLDSKPIRIGMKSFQGCKQLANVVLPKDSTAEEDSFEGCELLHERYGKDSSGIIAGLAERFDGYSIHKMCYDNSKITVQELRRCIADHQAGDSLVDRFGMTPFHVLFLTAEPSMEILNVLLESLPLQTLLKLKDSNGRRPLDYLMNNWSDGNIVLFQRTLQKWMMDRLARWGATSWKEAMQSKMEAILAEEDKRRRVNLCNEACATLERYENVQATSILEMALWKRKLRSGWTRSGRSKRQAFDRDERRCLSGSDVVISHVTIFLDIPRAASQDQ